MKTLNLTLIAMATLMSGCGENGINAENTNTQKSVISANLLNNDKEIIGKITVSGDDAGGVNLNVTASSISPGAHGMHFHQKADCSASDFKSAGGHINPMKMQHGLKNPDGPDNADMENAVADENGMVDLERMNPRVSMTGGGGLPALLDADGSALVIHINPDDQVTQPIGGAGARIACAEIQQ